MDAQKFLEHFRATPQGKQAERQHNEEILAERRKHIAAIAELKAESARVGPEREKEVTEAKARVERAEEELRTAKTNLQRAVVLSIASSADIAGQIAQHEAALRRLADPKIDEFLRELEAVEDKTRRSIDTNEIKTRSIWGSARRIISSNYQSIQRSLAAISATRDRARMLKLEIVEDLDGELEKLRQSIPAGDQYERTESAVEPIPQESGPRWIEGR